VTVSSALTNDLPPLVSTTRVDDTERVNRDMIFDLDSMAEEVATVSSHLSTEIFENDEALCHMDAELLVRNIDLVVISSCQRPLIQLLCNLMKLAAVLFTLEKMIWK
jgi:hypothetical protein